MINMPCVPFQIGETSGIICMNHGPIKLLRGVWMLWHPYCGPTFWRDEDCTKPIENWYKRRRLVQVFNKWLEERDE